MLKYRTRFPLATGWLVDTLITGLSVRGESYASGVMVQPKRPSTMPARLVTVRNDAGPNDGFVARRRYGFNVWATTSSDGEQLGLLAGAILRSAPASGNFSAVVDVSDPLEIEDDPDLTSSGVPLSHWYFTGAVLVRAADFI